MTQHTSDPFLALADPSRRHILQLLTKDSMTINALAENFDMSRPAVSKHVKMLYGAGFIAIKDVGRERYCSLREDGFRDMQKWISHFDVFWNQKLYNLDSLLKQRAKKTDKPG